MNHIALDLGGKKSQFCIRNAAGEILREGIWLTPDIPAHLAKEPPSRVILETCAEAFYMADQAIRLGHDPRVVPATLARTLGVGSHGYKDDRRDAQALSDASTKVDLRSVHIRSVTARERNSIVASRVALVHSRTLLINSVRGWARTQLLKIPAGAIATFASRVERAALDRPHGLPEHIARTLRVVDTLNAEIKAADAELATLAKRDESCKLLMTAPGVGPMTAILFLAAIDDPKRFPNASKVASYLGLVPGERSSSGKRRQTGITKAGPTRLRWCMTQACWSAWTHRPDDPLVRWARRIAERSGGQRARMVAIIAMARKLSGVLYAMLRDHKPYDPSRVCASAG